jgi:hypothetical protein
MMPMMGRFLIIAGGLMILLGLLLMYAGRIPLLGRLPGDIVIERKSFTLYFPIVTSVLLSLILTLILWIVSRK